MTRNLNVFPPAVVCAVAIGALGPGAAALAHDDAPHDAALPIGAGAASPPAPTSAAPPSDHVVSNPGRWSAPVDWPVLAVHAALMPTGEVLAWDATPDDFDDDPHTADSFTTRVTLWDPVSDVHTPMHNEEGGDLFCAGSSQLWDGRIVFAGGDSGPSSRNGPLSNSNLFDPWAREWRTLDQLNAPRWYSSVAPLASGKLLTYGGTYAPRPVAEVFELNHTWRGLDFELPLSISGDYAWLQTTSYGDVAYIGPDASTGVFGTGRDAGWSRFGTREADGDSFRGYGSYAMYDIDRVLISGGGNSLASALIFDTASGETSAATPMRHGRRQHNLTILADGSVLASGGNSSGEEYVDTSAAVAPTEIWLPETNTWHAAAALPSDRQYHSVALLLPDGRVLSAGGGYCGDCSLADYFEDTAEVFSPPYLFDPDGTPAVRPEIVAAPAHVDYNRRFAIDVDSAEPIDRAHLIKLGSTTHSQNQGQRLVPLVIEGAEAGRLGLVSPATRNIAPPGHYLLIVVDGRGVPSVAETVLVGQPLAGDGEVIEGRTRAGHVDVVELDVPDGHRLAVVLQRNAPDTTLRIRRDHFPRRDGAGVNGDGFDACDGTGDETLCTLDVESGGRFLVAVGGGGSADWAAVATTVPLADPAVGEAGAPAPPDAVALDQVGPNGFEVSWEGVPDVLGYQVYRNGELLHFVRDTMLFDENLESEQDVRYAVRAVGANGRRSAATSSDGGRTDAFGPPDVYQTYNRVVPTPPLRLRAYVHSSTQIGLVWDRSRAEEPPTRYEVYRDDALIAAGDFTGHVDSTLEPGVDHRYHVVGVTEEGIPSAPSVPITVNTETTERVTGLVDREAGPVTVGEPLMNDPDGVAVSGTGEVPPLADAGTTSGRSGGGGGAASWLCLSLLLLTGHRQRGRRDASRPSRRRVADR